MTVAGRPMSMPLDSELLQNLAQIFSGISETPHQHLVLLLVAQWRNTAGHLC